MGKGDGDPIRRLVGKLLDLQPVAGDEEGVENTEDYVYCHLHRSLHSNAGEEGRRRLRDEVKGWGMKHFGDVWSYALPLFLAGGYEDAIRAVKDHDDRGSVRSCTLAVVAGRRGLVGPDFRDGCVVQYARAVEAVSPCVAMDYLAEVGGRQVRKDLAKALLMNTRAYADLAGVVGDDGVRAAADGGQVPIDRLFGRGEVRDILRECGDELGREGGGGTDAAELYAMAGEYGRVLEVVNREVREEGELHTHTHTRARARARCF